jgi:hypothetical protein
MNVRLARWFLGLSMLFAAIGLSTQPAHSQVVVRVGQDPHHYHHRYYHHHHHHYYHHDHDRY